KLPNFIYADTDMLPAPAASDFDVSEASLALALDPKNRMRQRGMPPTTWPQLSALQVASVDAALPVPAADVFDIPGTARAEFHPFRVKMNHYAEGELPLSMTAAASPHVCHGRGGRLATRQHGRSARLAHAAPAAAAKHHATRPAAATGKRAVHIAS